MFDSISILEFIANVLLFFCVKNDIGVGLFSTDFDLI